MLKIYDHLPDGLLDARAEDLHERLGGPALVHLPGRREAPLFTSVLLHGNETTGLEAVQRLLNKYAADGLPRALSIFVGNVEAARHGVRRLEGQPDYNRVWPGCADAGTPEHAMMRQVVDEMVARRVFASIDVHNNTGLNPHYACVNRLDDAFFQLATLFSRTVVYFTTPTGVQSAAFAQVCPAVTVECGQSGQAHSVEHALEYLDACLHLSEVPRHAVASRDLDLFHTVVMVKVPPGVSFSFDGRDTDLLFDADLDQMNFRELAAGTLLGRLRPGSPARLQAWDNSGRDAGSQYFRYHNNEIRLTRSMMPSMLTLDERVIRQDCLCYLMERLSPTASEGTRVAGS
jgi:succinylglutamate desuccinylase